MSDAARAPVDRGLGEDARLAAAGVSKRYPLVPVRQFAPATPFFARDQAPLELVDDDDEIDEEPDDEDLPSGGGEGTIWALKDVSFSLARGSGLALLGGPGAGKSTLLRIVAGLAFPTEGTIRVGGRLSLLPTAVARAMSIASGGDALIEACRLLGLRAKDVRPHREEIEELARAGGGRRVAGPQDRTAEIRLGLAAAVALPADVILLDGLERLDPDVVARLLARARARVDEGCSVLVATRTAETVAGLCDQALWLDYGVVVADGPLDRVVALQQSLGGVRKERRVASEPDPEPFAAAEFVPEGRQLRIPRHLRTASKWAALVDAGARFDDGLSVALRLQTRIPNAEVRCGVRLTPASGAGAGVRLEMPEPIRFVRPDVYRLAASVPAGTLAPGEYDVLADAVVANPLRRRATAIALEAEAVSIPGDGPVPRTTGAAPVALWDGSHWSPVPATWSFEHDDGRLGAII